MNLPKYKYLTNASYLDYEFSSRGPNGTIKKVVRFTEIGDKLYNLGFGDLNKETGEIIDTAKSSNGDVDKVLATVAAITYDFTGHYIGVSVFAMGTTRSRTRLYQQSINKHWIEINALFEIFGLINDEKWEPFEKGKNYTAFLARRRTGAFFYG